MQNDHKIESEIEWKKGRHVQESQIHTMHSYSYSFSWWSDIVRGTTCKFFSVLSPLNVWYLRNSTSYTIYLFILDSRVKQSRFVIMQHSLKVKSFWILSDVIKDYRSTIVIFLINVVCCLCLSPFHRLRYVDLTSLRQCIK